MDILNKLTKGFTSYLDKNPTHVLVISLLITIYSALLAPRLPNSIIEFFDTFIGKLLLLFLIAFMASHNIQIALAVALGFLLVLHVVNYKKTEMFLNYRTERFNDYEEPDMDTFATTPMQNEVKDKKIMDATKEYNDMIYSGRNETVDVFCSMPSEKDSAVCKWYSSLKTSEEKPVEKPTEPPATPPTPAGQGSSTNATTTTTEFFTNCSAPQVAGPVDNDEYAPAVF